MCSGRRRPVIFSVHLSIIPTSSSITTPIILIPAPSDSFGGRGHFLSTTPFGRISAHAPVIPGRSVPVTSPSASWPRAVTRGVCGWRQWAGFPPLFTSTSHFIPIMNNIRLYSSGAYFPKELNLFPIHPILMSTTPPPSPLIRIIKIIFYVISGEIKEYHIPLCTGLAKTWVLLRKPLNPSFSS